MSAMGFTEHSFAHVTKVAQTASEILEELDYPEREQELASIAGYLHDIGNVVNRNDHGQTGAVMAFRILDKMEMEPEEVATVITAIGNHDEKAAFPVNSVAAALMIADKADVRFSRVRNRDIATFDIHEKTLAEWEVWFTEHNVDNHPLIVAEQTDGTVAGYASLSPYRRLEAYHSTVELSVYVHPAHRRKGIASALMQAILEEAEQDPRTHTVVSVITSGNSPSIRLHEKFNFTFGGTIREVGIKHGEFLSIDQFYRIL